MNRNIFVLLILAGGTAAAFFIYKQIQKQRAAETALKIPEGGLTWPPEEGGPGWAVWQELFKKYPHLQYPELIFQGKNQLPC